MIKSKPLFPRLGIVGTIALWACVLVAAVVFLPHTPASIPVLGPMFAGMFLDAQTTLSDAQALTATAYSTNTYDSGLAGRAVDVGEPLGVEFSVDVAAKTSNSDETYQILLVQSANADLSSHDILIQTDTTFMSRSFFTAGKKFCLPLPPGLKTKRYLGVRYVLGGTTPTLTITAEIQPLSMIQNDVYYASGFTISS